MKSLIQTICPLAFAIVFITPLAAEPTSERTKLALCDVAYLLDHYRPYQNTMRDAAREWTDFQVDTKNRRKTISELQQHLAAYKTSSDEYRLVEERLEILKSELHTSEMLKRRQLDRRRSESRSLAIKTLRNEIASFAKQHDIDLVINHNQSTNGDTELIAGGILYQNQLDITDRLMAVMKKHALATTPHSTNTAATATDKTEGKTVERENDPDAEVFSFFMSFGR